MKEKKTVAAFMYDFDNTLSTKDMQEYAFIPSINMDAKDFWAESTCMRENTTWIPFSPPCI